MNFFHLFHIVDKEKQLKLLVDYIGIYAQQVLASNRLPMTMSQNFDKPLICSNTQYCTVTDTEMELA